MKIEKLFSNLNRHKELIFYLFEQDNRIVFKSECEKIRLEDRVINFLENYLNIDKYNNKISKSIRTRIFYKIIGDLR